VLRDRVLDINPRASVHVEINFVRPDTADELLTHIESNRCSSSDGSQTVVTCYSPRFDFVVDATDSVSDKAAIIDACIKSGTPVVTSGGVGGLINPGLITVSDLAHVKGKF
jgi:tRNA A37 threonylcarbamoyladenosine dehydratase